MNQTEIYLRKRLKVVPPQPMGLDNRLVVGAMVRNFESLGYVFSQELFNHLCKCGTPDLEQFYLAVLPILKEIRGANKVFKPLYPNFPQQVMEASNFELWFNAICHYIWHVKPDYEKKERFPLLEQGDIDVIEFGTQTDFEKIFPTLLSAKTSITQYDKDVVKWFVEEWADRAYRHLPEQIPMKENLALLVGNLMNIAASPNALVHLVKTPTDVLRVLTVISGGDVSLAENTKFVKLKRRQRRFVLGMLEQIADAADMVKNRERWLRVGEILHPGEYAQSYPNIFKTFKALRDNARILTFNGKVEEAIKQDVVKASEILKENPGQFARRLDHLLRKAGKTNSVLGNFAEVVDRVSTPVLMQVASHFKNRSATRTIFPKGNLAKLKVLENSLPPLEQRDSNLVVSMIDDALSSRFAQLDNLGKVYVDPILSEYIVPFSQRSASLAKKTLVRGSRIPLDVQDTVRFFIWWKNIQGKYGEQRVDIDLAAAIFDNNWNLTDQITYYALRGMWGRRSGGLTSNGCFHSGDIVTAPGPDGACEFIDIPINKIQKHNRYVVMSIYSYTGSAYKDMECFAGWMGREDPNHGEVFEKKTVKNKVDLVSDTTIVIPLIIDLFERKVIWCDLSLTQQPNFCNLQNNKGNIALMCRAMCDLRKANLYDLLSLHALSRGEVVDKPEDADVVFGPEIAFDVDRIESEFL